MRRVLIVEDDRFISAIFTMFLKELGHELVGKCQSGSEAVELCHQLKPDVVLMDIHLEGDLDGIQTTEVLKTELDIPVIYVSSDTSSHVIKRAIVSNSYGFLVKPVNKKELGISIDLAYYKHKVDVEQKERERGYRQFISESPVPIVIVSQGKIQYLNNLALEVIFKTHYIEDVMLQPFVNYVANEYQALTTELLHNFSEKGICFRRQPLRIMDVHGRYTYVEASGSAVTFNSKQSLQIIIRDISNDILMQKKKESYKLALIESGIPFVVSNTELTVVESCFDSKHQFHDPANPENNRKVELIVDKQCQAHLKQPQINDITVLVSVDGKSKGCFSGLKIHDPNNVVSRLIFVPIKCSSE
jgi:PAS domain S-box-containing protein